MRAWARRWTLLGFAFTVSCASLTPAGSKVRITTNPDVVRGCTFLGEVKATSPVGGGALSSTGTDDSERRLKNKVAEMGGNVVMIRRQDQGTVGTARSMGEAYACPTPTLPTEGHH